ncbi:MAG TPA: CHAT domain-containing tetratricopeptide repeat protein, partial [Puia sp.]|nr:CHAT domain-containing tetratricopeptide repeat protein [Puia sp.]
LDEVSTVSIQTNIATSYYHLGLFARSLSIYNKILHYGLFTDPIYLNMGMAYTSLDKYEDALACFRKVNAKKMPGVLNEMAYAQMQLHRPDSSARLLDQWWKQYTLDGANDLDKGTNDLYRAGLLATQQQYLPALNSLQKAIILFSRNFNTEDIFSNPSNFTGTFASYRLYDALYQKAVLFSNLYRSQPREEYITASYAAYQAAISILRYIEKNYETDDAKIFLKKKNAEVYQGALSVCMELYRLHPGDHYLEQAFIISEKNKASVIMANLQQSQFQRAAEGLLQKERNIKYNIARLNVKIEAAAGSQQEAAMAKEKSAYEIQLSQLQKEWEKNDRYYQAKYADTMPSVKELQQHLDDHQQLISFYVTPAAVHIFLLTRSSFAYTRVDSVSALQEEVGGWLEALKTTESGRKFKGYDIGDRLYDRLIKPIQAAMPAREEWILVPDGFLWFLPFESLPAGEKDGNQAGGSNGEGVRGDGKTLLETTIISYRFSSRMLVVPASPVDDVPATGILSFAPFASGGGRFDGPDSVRFGSLPASGEEIAGLTGPQYMDSAATRDRFLKEIGQYPIIHLATHAVSSPTTASASFVAFFPRRRSLIDDCLFLEELYGLDMHTARLVVISACETGQGQLVNSEGVISLARAFAYAGCESTISSLWKADDRSTSLILQKFYRYLQMGYTRSKALQQAKLDYLAGDAVNKNPAYWSHLILIGNTEQLYKKKYPLKWSIVIICLGLVVGVVVFRIWKNGKKKSTLLKEKGF